MGSKQQWLLDNMAEVFRTVQREYQLPVGDFPDMEHFKACIKDYDFSKFPKLDLKYVPLNWVAQPALWYQRHFSGARMIEDMDAVLSRDVPKLMNQFPSER